MQQLQRRDAYLTGKGIQDLHAEAWDYTVALSRVSGTTEEVDSWWNRQIVRFSSEYAARISFGPARKDLHGLVESGSTSAAGPYLAVTALHLHAPDLVKLLVHRGMDVNKEVITGGNLRREYMPVAQRFDLLEPILENGAQPGAKTREFLPIGSELKCREVEMLRRHGYNIAAGDSPDNPCCIP